jgi:hypothetical protein
VYQILEVEDEWNILKCTLAILVGFLGISLFHETKIPMVDMKVQVSSNFKKIKI